MRHAALTRDDIERISAGILGRLGLRPGCDGRDVALSIGLKVSPHVGPTLVRGGTLLYSDRLHGRQRDWQICACVARHVLEGAGLLSKENADLLTLALTRRSSGFSRRIA